MRKIAFDYFKTQPSYQLRIAQAVNGVRAFVLRKWLEGLTLRQTAESILNTNLMRASVLKCKSYIVAVSGCSESFVDGEKNTRDICAGFLDYIADVYKECDEVID